MRITPDLRVGRCPGARQPMWSGDGLIVRVKPRCGTLSPEQGVGIAAVSAAFGNSAMDLTTRANLQIRGADEGSLPELVGALGALGLLDPDAGAEARRNVVVSPLAGLDPSAAFDIRPAVAALEDRLAADADLAALPAKFGFAVADGGTLPIDHTSADVKFEALRGSAGAKRFGVRLDGDEGVAAECGAGEVAHVAVRLAKTFMAARAERSELHRMRDLVARVGGEAVFARAGLAPSTPVQGAKSRVRTGVRARYVGLIDLSVFGVRVPDTAAYVLGVAAPFGRLDAAQLGTLARGALRAGAREVRFTSWRAILVPGLARTAAECLAEECVAAGLVVDPEDPRLRVAACVGTPGCERGTTRVLDDAAGWAPLLGPGDAADGIALHVSGCAKGCAHPGPASLTLVAEDGRYALVADGSAADLPIATGLDSDEVGRRLGSATRWDRQP